MASWEEVKCRISWALKASVVKTRTLARIATVNGKISDARKGMDESCLILGRALMEAEFDDAAIEEIEGQIAEAEKSGKDSGLLEAVLRVKRSGELLEELIDEKEYLKGITPCRVCGAEVTADSDFCCKCGAKVVPDADNYGEDQGEDLGEVSGEDRDAASEDSEPDDTDANEEDDSDGSTGAYDEDDDGPDGSTGAYDEDDDDPDGDEDTDDECDDDESEDDESGDNESAEDTEDTELPKPVEIRLSKDDEAADKVVSNVAGDMAEDVRRYMDSQS